MHAHINIHRTNHTSHYTILPNAIWESKLSIAAKTALGYILSKPPTWKIRITDLRNKLGIGRDKVYRALNELVAAGYAIMTRLQRGVRWQFFDTNQISSTPDTNQLQANSRLPEIQFTETQDVIVKNETSFLVSNKTTTTAAIVCDPRQADEPPSVVSIEPDPILEETKTILDEVERLPIDAKHKAPIVKTLASVSVAEAKSILMILSRALTLTPISNPIGYTVSLIRASKSGSLTIPSNTTHNIPIAERLKRQEVDRKKQAERHKVSNDQWAKSMIEMMGLDAFLKIAPWYKPS